MYGRLCLGEATVDSLVAMGRNFYCDSRMRWEAVQCLEDENQPCSKQRADGERGESLSELQDCGVLHFSFISVR